MHQTEAIYYRQGRLCQRDSRATIPSLHPAEEESESFDSAV